MELIAPCPSCGKKNRTDTDRDGAKCGACGAAIGAVQPLDDGTFRKFIVESPSPVLVDFFATWCGPCRLVAPAVAEVARLRADRLRVAKVDIDQAGSTAAKFGVSAVPTFVLLRGPKELARLEGGAPKAELLLWIDGALGGG